MSAHLQPQPSEIVQCFRFHTRVQQPHETIAMYVTQLKRLAEHCNFGNAERLDKMIRDRLVCRIANEKWQQRQLTEDKFTYDKAFKLLLSLEASKKEAKDLTHSDTMSIHQVHRSRTSPTQHSGKLPKTTGKEKYYKKCHRCGGEHNSSKCRFKDATCRFCHKKGHIASVCRQRLRTSCVKSTNTVTEHTDDTPDEYSLPIDCHNSS